MQHLSVISKWQNGLFSFPRQTIWYYSNPSMCPDHLCWRRWSWMTWWGPTRASRTNTKKKKKKKSYPFHRRELECKSRKPKILGGIGKFGLGVQNEAGQRQIEFCQENSLVISNTLFQKHKKRLYTWTSPNVNT